jgi:hypothetical protein
MKLLKFRILISILLFFIVFSAANKNASAADDKLLHFGVSSLFGAASESYLMAANIAGAFVGAFVANIFNNAIQVKIEKKEEEKMFVFSISYRF